jgi:hypothetical protein
MKDGELIFNKWKEIHGWKMESIRLCRTCAFDEDAMCLGRAPGICQMCGKHFKDTNYYQIGWLIGKIAGVEFDDKYIPIGTIRSKKCSSGRSSKSKTRRRSSH